MLQINEHPTWISFSEDVKKLKIRFINAELQKTLGFSSGQISDYITGKKMPSEKFLNKFYDVYGEPIQEYDRKKEEAIQPLGLFNLFREDGSLYKRLCQSCEEKAKRIIELQAPIQVLKDLVSHKK